MPDSVQTIVQNIINQIRATDPAFSLQPLTPERKIIEAVATQIAQAQVDFSVLDDQGNIDAMTGNRLDAYLNLFGFSRQLSTSATGTVTFSRATAALTDITIPFGTQVKASDTDPDTPDVYFTTTETVVLHQGEFTVDAPVMASTPGSIGNVAAGTVSGFATLVGIPGITTVTNGTPMTGGIDFESDEQLRVRFKNGIFRNMAGTFDQFMALALSGENTTKANVLGPLSRYQEYMIVPGVDDTGQNTVADPNGNYDNGGTIYAHKRTTAGSDIPYSKYTYAQQNYVTDGTLGGKVFRPDHDYFFNRIPVDPTQAARHAKASWKAAHQPNITILGHDSSVFPVGLEPGTVVLVEHAYMSAHSRNSIPAGITNAVDVFVNGSKSRSVKSSEMYPHAGLKLQNGDANKWTYYTNWKRMIDGSQPSGGEISGGNPNRLLPVFWQPMLSLPDSFTIKNANNSTYTFYKAKYIGDGTGGSTIGEYYADAAFTKVANYFEVQEVGGYFGTVRARSGIEFRHKETYTAGGVASGPYANDTANSANVFVGATFTLTYNFDQNIRELQAIMEKNKQITSDVLVHRATPRYFRFYLTVMYSPGANQTTTKALIDAQVQAFLEAQFFGAVIQLSDIIAIVHNTPGVDNVRWTRDQDTNDDGTVDDATIHKVREVNADGSNLTSPTVFDTDFFLQDNELATVPSVPTTIVTVKTQNTWGT